MAVIINRGLRTYQLAAGPKGEKRALKPGGSLEVTAQEAKRLLGYTDVVDASEAVPQNAQEIAQLRDENERLKAEHKELREMAPEPKSPVSPRAKKKAAKKKGK